MENGYTKGTRYDWNKRFNLKANKVISYKLFNTLIELKKHLNKRINLRKFKSFIQKIQLNYSKE